MQFFLSGLCERVYLVHRRDALRADQALQEKVFACENIEMVWDSVPLEILGQDEVTGLKIRNIKTNEERELTAEGVFIAVGIVPNTTLVKDQLKLDENGYICAGEEGVTSAPGVFCSGGYSYQGTSPDSNCCFRRSQCSGFRTEISLEER